MIDEEHERDFDLEAELLKREVLPGRAAKYDKDGREILLFRCSDCGYTVEDTSLASDYRCPLCDAKDYFFVEVDFKIFPNMYVNQPYREEEQE